MLQDANALIVDAYVEAPKETHPGREEDTEQTAEHLANV